MKTRNLFFVSALILFGLATVNSVKAEVPPTQTSDEVTVNIKFQPVQSIVVNTAQETVNLEYYTLQNYQEGVSVTMSDHLTVFSSGGFQVKVNSNGDFMESGGGSIPAGDVIVKATLGTNTLIGTPGEVALSQTATALITADQGGGELKYNVTYDNTAAGDAYAYITKPVGPGETVYTATVTYSIVAQ